MIPSRRHNSGATRHIRSAYEDQVPTIVAGYVSSLIETSRSRLDEMDQDFALRRIQDGLTIEHEPRREAFERAFLARRAHPAEIKIDPVTDRVYLIGLGLPGREEVHPREVLHRNGRGEVVAREVVTDSVIREDTVLVYTEITWGDFYRASDRYERLPDTVRAALCRYFQIPDHGLLPALAALDSLTDDDLHGIAAYVYAVS